MIISCPSCSAGFYVSPAQIGTTGRRVKCSKCKNIWHACIPRDALVKEDVIVQKSILNNIITGYNLPTVIPIEIHYILYIVPVIFSTLIMVTIWLLYPGLTDKVGICGTMCAGKNMKIENVIYDFDKSTNNLNIRYNITNIGDEKSPIPLVEIFLSDKHKVKLTSLTADPNKLGSMVLSPGKSISAKTAFAQISPEAQYLQIRLGSYMKFLFR